MPGNTEEYRGCIINWDVTDDAVTGLWKGTGTVQARAEAGADEVYSVPGRVYGFKSSEEAREHIIRTAKEWIDSR
jgi:hypothetical protein